ncbi:TetR/AcrR family transcriptional regulator [Paenibacillus nasutitermitis]|uniref:TetR family transcriptional regulator n=1 Tax=Paenibacillus nasutitermitis TaxID=1652958 RepID=A0A916YSR5_9BACL|nr:TetR/AcrR family transcriptional regulator [Paenibacillus nasutitermitis]GGD58671.1 TetR family transcriptional regulator [Paenibacillus nasutitermitis]
MSRDKILDAAAGVFSTKGYHRSSMDDIAQMAGVAKGTLYYHFPGKAQLFQALITEGLRMITGRIREEVDRDLPLLEQIQTVIRLNIQLYMDYSELAHIFFNELSSGIDEEVLLALKEERSAYIRFIAEILEEAGLKKMNCELAASGLLSMMNGFCGYHLSHPGEVEQEQIVQLLYAAVTTGLLNPRVEMPESN